MFDETFEALEAFGVFELFVDEKLSVALARGPGGDVGVVAFASTNDGSKEGDGAFLGFGFESLQNGVFGLGNDGFTGDWAVLNPYFGKE